MRVLCVAIALVCLGSIACNAGSNTSGTNAPNNAAAPAASGGPATQPYGTLAEVMRGILFPNSNIIFDTQTNDPGAAKKPGEGGGASASDKYAGVYTGWEVVDYAAVAIAEAANLITIPGRKCQNGKPVPVDQADFKKFAQGLVDAGKAAMKAAQSKSQDAMVEVSGTIADACLACHEVYRDVGTADSPMRCTPPAAGAAK